MVRPCNLLNNLSVVPSHHYFILSSAYTAPDWTSQNISRASCPHFQRSYGFQHEVCCFLDHELPRLFGAGLTELVSNANAKTNGVDLLPRTDILHEGPEVHPHHLKTQHSINPSLQLTLFNISTTLPPFLAGLTTPSQHHTTNSTSSPEH